MIDRGAGPPVLFIPGLQGRWEWVKPGIDALARHCRVITFSLGTAASADETVRKIDAALDQSRLDKAVICGVSLGGVVALRYALQRPDRTRGLVLASTPGPRWEANRRQAFFARHWASAAPLFALNALGVMLPEVLRARGWLGGLSFMVTQGARVIAYPAAPRRMKERYDLWLGEKREDECVRVNVPTLIVTGERELDRVVPVSGTLEYAERIPGARVARVERTGHIGVITRPERFAEIVARFARDCE